MNVSSPPSMLYPVVQDLTDEEYGCCCDDEDGLGDLSLRSLALPQDSPRAVHRIKDIESHARTIATSLSATQRRNYSMDFNRSGEGSNKFGSKFGTGLFRSRSVPIQPPHKRKLCLSSTGKHRVTDSATSTTMVDFSDSQTIETSIEEHTTKFDDIYVLTRQIMRCDYAQVWECVERISGIRYCVKIVDLRTIASTRLLNAARREVEMLYAAQSCQQVIQLLHCVEEKGKMYIVMEHCVGGNLLSKVVQQGAGLPEMQVKRIARSILQACFHLHNDLIMCHNDLQPSNILLTGGSQAKLCDFGNALSLDSTEFVHYTDLCAAYTAPEVLNGLSYNTPEADMWSVGVIVYFMLYGQTPFGTGGSSRTMMSRICRADYSFPPPEFNAGTVETPHLVTRKAKQFISCLMHMDPTVRLTAQEALEHAWLADVIDEDVVGKKTKKHKNQQQQQQQQQQAHSRGHRRTVSAGSSGSAGMRSFVMKKIFRQDSSCQDLASTSTISSSGSNKETPASSKSAGPLHRRLNSSRSAF